MLTYSKEHIDYLKKIKRNKSLVLLTQIIIIIIFPLVLSSKLANILSKVDLPQPLGPTIANISFL